MAARLGLPEKRLEPYPSISLGAEEATPLEMASAYATIANDGVYHEPRFVEKVVDRKGEVVFEGPDKGKRAVSPQSARVAISVLRAVVERGTGTRARLPGRDVAGKTGTSQEYENAWFVGFTPQLSTAVWMGSPVGNVPMRSVGGIRVTGGSYPARIWNAFMVAALKDLPNVAFPMPGPLGKGRARDRPSRFEDDQGRSTDESSTFDRDAEGRRYDRRPRRPGSRSGRSRVLPTPRPAPPTTVLPAPTTVVVPP
jgi:membrane peptidoglycan carboxypeptidase